MTPENTSYIISGGQEGKSRLNVLFEALYPYTKPLLGFLGLGPGASMLDLGCGGGNVAMLAAGIVGGTGKVTGVDIDAEIIALARQDAVEADLHNIDFTTGSAYDIAYRNEFDIAFARFLLSHLQRPEAVLKNMIAAVKPGGRVLVEDIQFGGHFCHPGCAGFDAYVQYYAKAAANNGHNAEIGPALFGMFQQAGLADVGFDVIQPAFNTGTGKWMAFLTLDRIKHTLVKQGLATMDEIENLLQELAVFTKDENTIISLPRIFRVWGVKR